VRAGEWLSDHPEQDSYSYLLAEVYVGAESSDQLDVARREIPEMLPFDIEERERER
jgi:hypothetical protein